MTAKVPLIQMSWIDRKVAHTLSWRQGDVVFVFALRKRIEGLAYVVHMTETPCLCGQVAGRRALVGL